MLPCVCYVLKRSLLRTQEVLFYNWSGPEKRDHIANDPTSVALHETIRTRAATACGSLVLVLQNPTFKLLGLLYFSSSLKISL